MMKKELLILIIIIIIGAFLRFYKLTEFPIQLSHDEVTQLYDAISVAQTGKDIYGNFLPTIFVSINDFKPPFYTYITAFTYFLTGAQEITIRVPGALFGILIIPAVFVFVKELFNHKTIALYAAFLTAITPFEIHFSRKGFEGGAGVFFLLVGFSSLLHFMKNSQKQRYLYIGLGLLGVGMYTYFSHAIIIPILTAGFIYIFNLKSAKFLKNYINPAIFFFILIIPLIAIIYFNEGSRNRSQAVFITQDSNLSSILNSISAENLLLSTLSKNYYLLEYSFNRYLSQLDPIFLFKNGLGFTNQKLVDMGPFYYWQLPFLVLGIIFILKKPQFTKEKKFILFWIVIGMIPSGLTFEVHSIHRSLMVFTVFNIISAIGLYWANVILTKLSISRLLVVGLRLIMAIVISINFVYFIHLYTVNLLFEKSSDSHYPFKQVSQYAWSQHDNFEQIIIDPQFGEAAPVIGAAAHYYLAYYGNFPPEKMQKEYKIGTMNREVLFDKFSIREVNWTKDESLKNVLIIASKWSLPDNVTKGENVIHTFYYYNGEPAFYAIKLK